MWPSREWSVCSTKIFPLRMLRRNHWSYPFWILLRKRLHKTRIFIFWCIKSKLIHCIPNPITVLTAYLSTNKDWNCLLKKISIHQKLCTSTHLNLSRKKLRKFSVSVAKCPFCQHKSSTKLLPNIFKKLGTWGRSKLGRNSLNLMILLRFVVSATIFIWKIINLWRPKTIIPRKLWIFTSTSKRKNKLASLKNLLKWSITRKNNLTQWQKILQEKCWEIGHTIADPKANLKQTKKKLNLEVLKGTKGRGELKVWREKRLTLKVLKEKTKRG